MLLTNMRKKESPLPNTFPRLKEAIEGMIDCQLTVNNSITRELAKTAYLVNTTPYSADPEWVVDHIEVPKLKIIHELYGEGTDCDTCGWNFDEGQFILMDKGVFAISTRYGCYSGNHIMGKLYKIEARKQLMDELSHIKRFMGVPEELFDLISSYES